MNPIEVFYHVYIPQDIRATFWPMWVDQQLSLIKASKLPAVAHINMAITMPKYWSHMHGIPFRKNGDASIEITFEAKVREYINLRYPFVNIIDIRDTGEQNIFEGQTLKLIWDRCQQNDFDVLYIHSKGVNSSTAPVSNWREILNHFFITEWPSGVAKLATVDVVGIKDACLEDLKIVSANFWWSKASHIRTLPDPMDTTLYMSNPEFHPTGSGYRYAFEYWVRSNDPSVDFLVDTNGNHFDNYCFLEDLLK